MRRTAGRLPPAPAALTVTSAAGPADDEAGFVPLFGRKTLAGRTPEFTERFAVCGGVIANDGGTASDAITLPEGDLGPQGEDGRFAWRSLRIKEFPAR